MPQPLPIDEFVPRISETLAASRVVIVTAEPGAGKSTRVPPALTNDGPVILLQPRRVAARSLARRIAEEQRWTLGREVGWHVRFDRRFSAETRLLVATEGILTARMQSDPLISDFRTVVLDEFHERSVHADLAIALMKQALDARDDLRLVVMSATLDIEPLQRFLGNARVIAIPGRTFPVDIHYRPQRDVPSVVREISPAATGHVLAFLPGAREIDDAANHLRGFAGGEVHRLHGSLPAEEQDRALAPSSKRKIILATNIAETSLTIDGVTDVVDSGEHKLLRFDAEHAIDRLVLERIPADSAAQRAGRAGRTSPGRAFRLWDERSLLRPHREPEIMRVDLTRTVLELLVWGGDPRTFEWFDPPRPEAIGASLELLRALGAFDGARVTELGRSLQRFSLHPRIARFLLGTSGSPRARLAAAILEEGRLTTPARASASSESDLLVALDERRDDAALRAVAQQLARETEQRGGRPPVDGAESSEGRRAGAPAPHDGARERRNDDATLRRAAFVAYPDRVARRRGTGSDQFLLASGTGATLSRGSSVVHAEWLVALDLGTQRDGSALIRAASAVDAEWLEATHEERVHALADDGRVRAVTRRFYGAIVMREASVAADPLEAEKLIAAELRKRVDSEELQQFVRRARFAGVDVDWDAVTRHAAAGEKSARDIRLLDFVPYDVARSIDREAPTSLEVPSGRRMKLEYGDDGTVQMSVKLQEMFGLATTPVIGSRRVPVTILLLAPNGRPVQTTRDLESFWKNTYPEVRKELRGRYPKHPWPEDPTTATPTARAKRRG